jgi:hypothetical protein
MQRACIRGNFDFDLKYSDRCGAILYQDLSDWMVECAEPSFYDLEITLPNNDSLTIPIKVGVLNKITPTDLGMPENSNLDGVYCFKVNVCGIEFKRYKAVTCQLECIYDRYISNLIVNSTPESLIEATKIEILIRSIHYNAERGLLHEVKFLYDKAKSYLNCPNCYC